MMLPGYKGATTIKLDDAGMMKFRGFPRRTSCRRLSMNRMAHGLKWKTESAARMLRSRPLRAYHGTSSVLSCRARGCHRGNKWVSNMRQKLRARTEKVSVPLVQTVPLVGIFFRQHFPISAGTQPKDFSEESFPIAFYPTFLFHHYDWSRWFASLATTVDNTIKMAECSFKHGRQ